MPLPSTQAQIELLAKNVVVAVVNNSFTATIKELRKEKKISSDTLQHIDIATSKRENRRDE